ncbi:MAG: hypothetical protein K8F28_00490, partial [Ignavibacteriaceae bacterium]|nr:hypothetical protein [Ignavibacteriaceae bacterium]
HKNNQETDMETTDKTMNPATGEIFDFSETAEKLAKVQQSKTDAEKIKRAFMHARTSKENAEYLLKLLYEKELLESILAGKNKFCIHVAGHNIDVHFREGMADCHLTVIKDMLSVIEENLAAEVDEFVSKTENNG